MWLLLGRREEGQIFLSSKARRFMRGIHSGVEANRFPNTKDFVTCTHPTSDKAINHKDTRHGLKINRDIQMHSS